MRRRQWGKGPRYQRGISMILVTVGMVALLAAAGLALDMGDFFNNKTRLQNALDASALSGAQSLELTPGDTAAATAAARATFDENKNEGNGALASIADTDVHTEFSDTLVPWAPGSGTGFIRVWIYNFDLPSYLIQVLGINRKTVAASATAGPAQVNCPTMFPFMACADTNHDPANDPNGCPVGSSSPCFWGYTPGDEVVLKHNASGCPDPTGCDGPGNFQVLDVGAGAAAVRSAICGVGTYQCVQPGNTVDTEPGNIVGPVGDAINAMFGIYGGGLNSTNCPNLDTNTAQYGPQQGTDPYYPTYQQGETTYQTNTGLTPRETRVVVIPLGTCSTDSDGKTVVTVDGYGCFLVTHSAEISGTTEYVYGEFLGSLETCRAKGYIKINQSPNGGGPTQIILYKDQVMTDG